MRKRAPPPCAACCRRPGGATKLTVKLEKQRQNEVQHALRGEDSDEEVLVLRGCKSESRVALLNSRYVFKPHQRSALRVVCENVLISLVSLRRGDCGFGVMLAHSMGMGNSLVVVALYTLLLKATCCKTDEKPCAVRATAQEGKLRLDCVLVVAPAFMLDNWQHELEIWSEKLLGDTRMQCKISPLARRAKTVEERKACVRRWEKSGGALLVGFEMYTSLLNAKSTTSASHSLRVPLSHFSKSACVCRRPLAFSPREKARECVWTYRHQRSYISAVNRVS